VEDTIRVADRDERATGETDHVVAGEADIVPQQHQVKWVLNYKS